MSARASRWIVWPAAVFFTALFLAKELAPESALFTRVFPAPLVEAIASIAKLLCQLLGSIFAARCASKYEPGTPIRSAWWFASGWLGGWFAGQIVLAIYLHAIGHSAPVPSLGDAFFFFGYACLIVAVVRFIAAYRTSGFAVGALREHLTVIVVASAVLGAIGYVILAPFATADTPLAERLVNVGYPVLDFVLLVPAIVLLRIAWRFRGGRVWTVWAALLTGIVFAAGGDILYADVSPENNARVGPLVDLLLILSYLFSAYGARLQYELLTD